MSDPGNPMGKAWLVFAVAGVAFVVIAALGLSGAIGIEPREAIICLIAGLTNFLAIPFLIKRRN